MNARLPALLLMGPTSSGKTPLGQLLAELGFAGRRCVHFDFGENLRRVVTSDRADKTVTVEDIAFLRQILETGALLEDEDFPIAERLLWRFLACEEADDQTVVVLNGLPRHTGQAAAIAATLDIQTVVSLRCSPETVLARITGNTGGDRTHRTDDDLEAVRKKLAIFAQRTAALEDYYRAQGATVIELVITAEMTAEQMWQALNSH